MNEPSNAPLTTPAPGAAGWMPIWIKAVTQPREQTYIDITDHPDARSRTALLWIFIAGTLAAIVNGLLQALILAMGFTSQPVIPGLEQYGLPSGSGTPGLIGTSLVTTLCASPVAGLFSVLGFAISVGLIQWVAKLFGGVGNFDKMSYAIAAISVPFTLLAMLITPFAVVPYLGICTGLISAGVGIYALVLQIMAVKGVNRFGWGAAVGSVFLPGLVIFLLCLCVVLGGLALMGPVIKDVLQQLNGTLSL
jgi:hypothetical protein